MYGVSAYATQDDMVTMQVAVKSNRGVIHVQCSVRNCKESHKFDSFTFKFPADSVMDTAETNKRLGLQYRILCRHLCAA